MQQRHVQQRTAEARTGHIDAIGFGCRYSVEPSSYVRVASQIANLAPQEDEMLARHPDVAAFAARLRASSVRT